MQAWPKLLLMVYAREAGVKDVFVSYALVPLPNLPGAHTLSVRTWYPTESDKVNVRNVFGGSLREVISRKHSSWPLRYVSSMRAMYLRSNRASGVGVVDDMGGWGRQTQQAT
jgi:hypothetical protein